MAEEERSRARRPSNAGWSVLPGTQEWDDAERVCVGYMRSHFPLHASAEDAVQDALTDASRTYEGRNEATFATLAVRILIRAVSRANGTAGAELADSDGAHGADSDFVPEPEEEVAPSARARGRIAALGRVFGELFQHEGMMVEVLMFRDRAGLASYLRSVLGDGGFLDQALRGANLLPIPASFAPNFDARLVAYSDELLGLKEVELPGGAKARHWVESVETMDIPLRVVGRRRAEPPRRLRRGRDPRIDAAFAKMRMRHAGLAFASLRREAALSILRYAMKQAGINGTLVHRALSGGRAARSRELQRERTDLIRAFHRELGAQKRAKSDT